MTAITPRKVLIAHIENLSPKDQDFARSLIFTSSPSKKQLLWIEKLATLAVTGKPNGAPARTSQPPAKADGMLAIYRRTRSRV